MPQNLPITIAALLALSLALAVATSDRALPAQEIDALAGGGTLVDAVFDEERPAKTRLKAGFFVDRTHPRSADFKGRRAWGRQLVDAPLPRWSAALAILAAPSGLSDRRAAQAFSALLMALTALLMFTYLGGGAHGLMGALATLASAAALDAAGGAGAGAISALAMAALLMASRALLSKARGAIPLGLAWGLLFACHPGALFLVVPIFSAVAIAWTHQEGHAPSTAALRLPAIPWTLLITPIIALGLLIALWPTLWSDTSRGLSLWLTDTWWAMAPEQTVLGERYHQASGRAPAAYVATLQWLSLTPWPILLAWIAGLVQTLRAGRRGLWTPVLMLVTVLLVGGLDGGLFGGRKSLMPWLWVCTAPTAALGLSLLGGRLGPSVAALSVLWALMIPPSADLGMQARSPSPVAQLEAISERAEGARVHVAKGSSAARYAIETLAWRADLKVQWAEATQADWVIVLDPEGIGSPQASDWWSEQRPEWQRQVGGLKAWTLRR